ncbi:hypothetical protein COLO4_03717 [Corchorus olitorius]|uniref:Uncharacterized protein n=1 Tax=Corchorus olitorius TaxID=93759 RepID=A0A1R3KXH4_9ROSI|nr:hypothetical protein COLO4_03717 [Corchorus olitorius]
MASIYHDPICEIITTRSLPARFATQGLEN